MPYGHRPPDLARTSRGNIPSVPGRREDMLSTHQDASNSIIRTTDLVVERRDAGAGCGRQPGNWIGRAAVGTLKGDPLGVVRERVHPAVTIIVKIGVQATDVDGRSV